MEKTVRHFGNIHQVNGVLHVKPELHEDGITRFIHSKRFSKHKKPNHGMGIIEDRDSQVILYEQATFGDIPIGSRFYGQPGNAGYGRMFQLSVKTGDNKARVIWTNQVYGMDTADPVLIQQHVNLSFIIKTSPERATQMATTKKASKKASAAKKTSVKKSTPAGKKTAGKKTESGSKREGPTKKEMVAKYLKDGKKAQEIVDAMAKDGVTTTLASVRCFIQAINNGQ